jgi:hypothetical protein
MRRLSGTVTAEHQIVLRLTGSLISLSCTCLRIPRRGRPGWDFIGMRSLFPAAEVRREWQSWHEQEGIPL